MNSVQNASRFLIAAILSFAVVACNQNEAPVQAQQQQTEAVRVVRRAAFDVGSGTVKVKVADVDVFEQKVLKIVLDEEKKVDFKGDMAKRNNTDFSNEVMDLGKAALTELKEKAMALDPAPTQFAGVATAAFRSSANGGEFVAHINADLGLNLQIITQDTEALVGLAGATIAVGQETTDLHDLVVWDIGNGSMQISTANSVEGATQIVIFKNQQGSTPTRNRIIVDVLKKEIKGVTNPTPNPLINGADNFLDLSKDLIGQVATNDVDSEAGKAIVQKLSLPQTRVIGIGGVHYHSVRKQADADKNSVVTFEEITEAINRQAVKDDAAIGGEFASTEVSNLILVQSYMKALGIKQVECAKVNLADGTLVMPNFWNKAE